MHSCFVSSLCSFYFIYLFFCVFHDFQSNSQNKPAGETDPSDFMSRDIQCNDNALLLSIDKPITRPLASQVEIAPAISTVINIIFNYEHSCVSVASWDHTKQRDYYNNTLLTILFDQLGLQTLAFDLRERKNIFFEFHFNKTIVSEAIFNANIISPVSEGIKLFNANSWPLAFVIQIINVNLSFVRSRNFLN